MEVIGLNLNRVMNQNILLLFILIGLKIGCSKNALGQIKEIEDSIKIIETEYYKGKGVIFPKSYTPSVAPEGVYGRFTPSLEIVQQAERILVSQYNKLLSSFENFEKVDDVQKEFKNYNRQYLGLIDSIGNKIILVHLMNFSNRNKSKKYFKNWDKDFIIGLGGFYDENAFVLFVDLENEELKSSPR